MSQSNDTGEIVRSPDEKGRITLPPEMRGANYYVISQSDDGTITLRPAQITTA